MESEKEKICTHCGEVHDISDEDLEQAASDFTDHFFEDIWKDQKEELKEMSKKELAEQMYFLGVLHYMKSIEEFAANFDYDLSKAKEELKKRKMI